MMNAAVVIDDWKLPVFVDELTKAGFKFEQKGSLTPGTLVLTVYTETIAKLQPIIVEAQKRAAREKEQLMRSNANG